MTTKRDAIERTVAALERRLRTKGSKNLNIRLTPAAMAALEERAARNGCSRSDVIEAMLLGEPIKDPWQVAMIEHGLSESEAREFVRG